MKRFSALINLVMVAVWAQGLLTNTFAATPRPVAEIQIGMRNRLPTTTVTISGKSLPLFLDLGAAGSVNLTTGELATTAPKYFGDVVSIVTANGTHYDARRYVLSDVVIGGAHFGGIEGIESVIYPGGPPDRNGNLGVAFLGKYLLVVDYPAHRVRLYDSGDEQAMRSECGSSEFSIDLVDGVAESIGSTESGRLRFMWDTGSTDNVIRSSVLPKSYQKSHKNAESAYAVVNSIQLDNVDIGTSKFRVIEFPEPDVDAVFGTDFFAVHRVCIDLIKRKGAIAAG